MTFFISQFFIWKILNNHPLEYFTQMNNTLSSGDKLSSNNDHMKGFELLRKGKNTGWKC